jgi:hypothetical protein
LFFVLTISRESSLWQLLLLLLLLLVITLLCLALGGWCLLQAAVQARHQVLQCCTSEYTSVPDFYKAALLRFLCCFQTAAAFALASVLYVSLLAIPAAAVVLAADWKLASAFINAAASAFILVAAFVSIASFMLAAAGVTLTLRCAVRC